MGHPISCWAEIAKSKSRSSFDSARLGEPRSGQAFDFVPPRRDSLRMTKVDWGSCYPTLATKTETSRGWGTQLRGVLEEVDWGSCYPTLAKLGWGTRFLWWGKSAKSNRRSLAPLGMTAREVGFVSSHPSGAWMGHPFSCWVERRVGVVRSHPCGKNKCATRMGHPVLWCGKRGAIPGLKIETRGHPGFRMRRSLNQGRREGCQQSPRLYFAQAVIQRRVRSLHGGQKKRNELRHRHAKSEMDAMT